MKYKLSKKYTLLVFIGIGIFCISIFLLIFNTLKGSSFKMLYDSDEKSYYSSEFGYNSSPNIFTNNNYLHYDNNKLTVKNFSRTKVSIFSENDTSNISIPKDALILDRKMYYINSGNLYCEDLDNKSKTLIDDSCKTFCINDSYISYQKNNSIILSDINNFENKNKIVEVDNEIYYYNIQDNILYLIERNFKSYNFISYNLEDFKQINYHSFDMGIIISSICLSHNNIYFYYKETEGIFSLNMETGNCNSIIYHPNVVDMAINDDKLYFISEKTEGEIIIKTSPAETNGVWELDVNTADAKKLSTECAYSDLLATDNYVYCYKTEYILPRGMAPSWVKGYEINQLDVPNAGR